MNAIHRILRNGIAIERVQLLRATLNEAQEIHNNLLDDISAYKKIIVDLSSCNYIDSTFFGAMVNAYRKIKLKGGSIVLIIGETFLSRSFIYKDITSVFKVFRSTKDAMRAFSNPCAKTVNDNHKNFNARTEPANIVQAQLILNSD